MAKKNLSWDALVEERIQNALAEGRFDNLPDFGQPCAAIDEPYDELWWIRRLMRREGLAVLPAILEIRKVVEDELKRIEAMTREQDVRQAVTKLNEKIRAANVRSVSGPASTTCLLEVDKVVDAWQERRFPMSQGG